MMAEIPGVQKKGRGKKTERWTSDKSAEEERQEVTTNRNTGLWKCSKLNSALSDLSSLNNRIAAHYTLHFLCLYSNELHYN